MTNPSHSVPSLEFAGTGTSQGVPVIGCRCPVCTSADPRDSRMRASALLRHRGMTVLVDAGPDFRTQMLRAGVGHLDAILLTHNHKDHTGGLDDTRSLNYVDARPVDIYCEQYVLDSLRQEYPYAFSEDKYPGAPEWRIHLIDDRPFKVEADDGRGRLEWIHDVGYKLRSPDGTLHPTGEAVSRAGLVDDPLFTADALPEDEKGLEVVPVRGYHHDLPVLGYRVGDIAYLTDMSSIPEDQFDRLRGLKVLTLNTVGYKPHHSHFSLDEALLLAGRIGASRTYLTHLSHAFPTYEAFAAQIRSRCEELGVDAEVLPSYDTLELH